MRSVLLPNYITESIAKANQCEDVHFIKSSLCLGKMGNGTTEEKYLTLLWKFRMTQFGIIQN